MTWIRSLTIAVLTYVVVDSVLGLVAQFALPGDVDGHGHPTGLRLLLCDLVVQAVAVFLAGALAAGPGAGPSLGPALASCAGVFALVLGGTLALWSTEPAWFDVACILMTPPLQLLGVAWRRAGREARLA